MEGMKETVWYFSFLLAAEAILLAQT